ncbi:glutamate racemase [Alicycliphilus sp. B1]|nr:glutamate racemase [Alicycliphilus sp. B1]
MTPFAPISSATHSMTEPLAARPIGVFDSGIGGLSVLQALRHELPHEDFVYLADSGNAPYGDAKGEAFVQQRTLAIARWLRAQHGIKALVVACNTATAAAVEQLRATLPDLPAIGVEPALKPAAARSQTHHVGVLATRGTVGSARFQRLLHGGIRRRRGFAGAGLRRPGPGHRAEHRGAAAGRRVGRQK